MITLIEALNFRCLRYIRRPLTPFHALVGPNASGKTTFLDVVAFMGQLVANGPEAAVRARSENFQDLVWKRQGAWFELAIDAAIPDDLRCQLANPAFDVVRYEVRVGADPDSQELSLLAEKVLLKTAESGQPQQRLLFPVTVEPPGSILTSQRAGTRTVVNKVPGGNDNFYSEVDKKGGKGWMPSIRLGPGKSALGNLPADETRFPVATWLKKLLAEGVQQFVLNSLLIRKASPPGQGRRFRPDGSNLPWV
ncbi:MAG: ATP-binding protein, partial [Pseudomonadota bacterium]|nr:ATP-binding protein [Pseudomonadota bacterium]